MKTYNTITIFTKQEQAKLDKLDQQYLLLNSLYFERFYYEGIRDCKYLYNSLSKTYNHLEGKYNYNRNKITDLIEKRIINENIANEKLTTQEKDNLIYKKDDKARDFWNI